MGLFSITVDFLEEGENVILKCPCNTSFTSGMAEKSGIFAPAAGGQLVLTNKRLVFQAHKKRNLGMANNMEWKLSDIASVGNGSGLNALAPGTINISFIDGTSRNFNIGLQHKSKWKKELNKIIKK